MTWYLATEFQRRAENQMGLSLDRIAMEIVLPLTVTITIYSQLTKLVACLTTTRETVLLM
jgi:hypothetical protein